jgi:hypothetical protein
MYIHNYIHRLPIRCEKPISIFSTAKSWSHKAIRYARHGYVDIQGFSISNNRLFGTWMIIFALFKTMKFTRVWRE